MSVRPEKLALLRTAMREAGIPALHLVRPENLAWLTGARTYIAISSERGVAEGIVTQDQCAIISNAIEAGRLREEEGLTEIKEYVWWDGAERQKLIDTALNGAQPLSDIPGLPAPLEQVRLTFNATEVAELTDLGKRAGRAIARAARALRPELTEFEAAGLLAHEVYQEGLLPVVNLCAGAERLQTRRHPLPTGARLGARALLVLSARAKGAVLSVSRAVSFAPLTVQEQHEYLQLLEVEAAGLEVAERHGTLEELFFAMGDEYARLGRPAEIEKHHQGGLAGYRPRESRAEPGNRLRIQDGMLVALNPTFPNFKVEDTFLLAEGKLKDLTLHDWPTLTVQGRGRPEILHVFGNS